MLFVVVFHTWSWDKFDTNVTKIFQVTGMQFSDHRKYYKFKIETCYIISLLIISCFSFNLIKVVSVV